MNALRVVKVGGSLFDYDDLVPALRKWLSLQPPLTTILIAGGGRFTDAIRAADARYTLGEEASHWLCVSALGTTARLLAALLPEGTLHTEGIGELSIACAASTQLFIFDPQRFLREEDLRATFPLPCLWGVTSDSIAARMAEKLGAEELVLLKSASCDDLHSLDRAAEAGYVDPYFPIAAGKLNRIRAVNLRDDYSLKSVSSPPKERGNVERESDAPSETSNPRRPHASGSLPLPGTPGRGLG